MPCLLKFEDGSTITYTYDANGQKLRTVHNIGENITTKDYCGNVIFENGKAKLLLTEAGYITLTDKKHHFFLQDHQGNNRVVADENGNIEEVNHYYPFGGTFASAESLIQPYKYNGKEMDTKNGLNWYDYGARMYDPAIGRWSAGDPMAEKYYGISPYAYCNNNPVNLIDPTGNVFTRYQDQYGNLLANTNDGSHNVVTVPNSRIDEFKKHLLYTSDYLQSSQGWNNYWTDEFKGTEAFKPTPEQQAVLDMQHSDWARKNGIEYLKEPNLWNWLKYVGSEVLSQYTDPELVAGGLSAGISGNSFMRTKFRSVEDVLNRAGKLQRIGNARQGFIYGENINEVVSDLAKYYNAPLQSTTKGAFFKTGNIRVGTHPSTLGNGTPTLDINMNNKIYKIRFK